MIRTPRGILPAVVLVIAALMTACGGEKAAPDPDGSATPSPSNPAKAVEAVIDVAKLGKGVAPKVPWLQGRTLHTGDQSVRLPGGQLDDVAVLGDRLVLSGRPGSGSTEIEVLDGTGAITARYPDSGSRLVTNGKRNIVAWIAADNTPMALQAGHKKPAELRRDPKGTSGDAVAVVGDDCFNGPETVEGAGCSVYFMMSRTDAPLPYVASEHGIVDRVDTKIATLSDVSGTGALIGTTGGKKTCGRYESEDASYETCDHIPDTFSPDGRNFIAYPAAITEGPTTDSVTVLDSRTGKPRLTVRGPADSPAIWQAVWEDDSHVLVYVTQGEYLWAIVRVGLDGKAELAAGPKKDAKSITVFGFATQP
jgi:hypothetical protein